MAGPSAIQAAKVRARCNKGALVHSGRHTKVVADFAVTPEPGHTASPRCEVSGDERQKLGSGAVRGEVEKATTSQAADPAPKLTR